MSEALCREIVSKLPDYQDRSLSVQEKQRVARHLRDCADCQAEWLLRNSVRLAAASSRALTAERTLTAERKHRVFAAVQRELREQPRRSAVWPGWLGWPTWVAAGALAAVMAVVVFGPWGNAPPKGGPHELLPGVDVVAEADSDLEAKADAHGPRLTLKRGWVTVRFRRAAATGPLVIATAHGRVVVRGTVFSVSVNEHETSVVVARGRVEISAKQGAKRALDAGQRGVIQREASVRGKAEASLLAKMLARWPPLGAAQPPPSSSPEPVQAPTSAEESSAAPRSGDSLWSKGARREHDKVVQAGRGALLAARRATQRGDNRAALAQLLRVRVETLPAEMRAEVLYQRASTERYLGKYHQALRSLSQVVDLGGERGALARLDRARIYRHALNDPEAALRVLTQASSTGMPGWVAEEVAFERCSLLVETAREEQAKACLTEFTDQYPDSHHRAAADTMRHSPLISR
jgi:ferric-dicitrate binding protein FerR (iron transport regulator)